MLYWLLGSCLLFLSFLRLERLDTENLEAIEFPELLLVGILCLLLPLGIIVFLIFMYPKIYEKITVPKIFPKTLKVSLKNILTSLLKERHL